MRKESLNKPSDENESFNLSAVKKVSTLTVPVCDNEYKSNVTLVINPYEKLNSLLLDAAPPPLNTPPAASHSAFENIRILSPKGCSELVRKLSSNRSNIPENLRKNSKTELISPRALNDSQSSFIARVFPPSPSQPILKKLSNASQNSDLVAKLNTSNLVDSNISDSSFVSSPIDTKNSSPFGVEKDSTLKNSSPNISSRNIDKKSKSRVKFKFKKSDRNNTLELFNTFTESPKPTTRVRTKTFEPQSPKSQSHHTFQSPKIHPSHVPDNTVKITFVHSHYHYINEEPIIQEKSADSKNVVIMLCSEFGSTLTSKFVCLLNLPLSTTFESLRYMIDSKIKDNFMFVFNNEQLIPTSENSHTISEIGEIIYIFNK